MNFDQPIPSRPRTLPRANTPPQQPPSQPPSQPPAEGGVDPAALIAARTAAVARNRQREARAAMVRDVLRIVFVVVILGGVAWVGLGMHRHRMEEERQRAEHEQKRQAERAKEQKEREERLAAEREAQRQIDEKKAAEKEAERRRREDENKARAKAAQEREVNVRRYEEAMKRFNGTTLAPFADLPRKVTGETRYLCVMPIGLKDMTLFEILVLPGKETLVTRLDEEGTVTNIPYADFSDLKRQNSYLLVKGTYCYYKGTENWTQSVPVPSANMKRDPSRDDLLDLYKFAKEHCNNSPALSYEVFFVEAGLETRVHEVRFGETFGRTDIMRGLQQLVGSGTARGRSAGVNDLQSRLNKGGLVIRRKERSR